MSWRRCGITIEECLTELDDRDLVTLVITNNGVVPVDLPKGHVIGQLFEAKVVRSQRQNPASREKKQSGS